MSELESRVMGGCNSMVSDPSLGAFKLDSGGWRRGKESAASSARWRGATYLDVKNDHLVCLNVVLSDSLGILKHLAGENQALPINWVIVLRFDRLFHI